MNCLWAIIDARRSWRRRLSLILRINFDQFPRLTINKLFALLGWLKGVRYFLSASGAYSLLFILLRRLRLFKPVIETRDAKKQNFFLPENRARDFARHSIQHKAMFRSNKARAFAPQLIFFLFFSAIFSLYLKKRKKNENQVFFCKQARRETLISLRRSSLFAQLLVWRGRWFLPIRYLKPIYFTVDNTILKYKDYTSAWTLGKRFSNNSDSLFDCEWKTTHDAPETITVHYYRAETEILVSTA